MGTTVFKSLFVATIVATIVASAGPAHAQDAHYWTQRYGTTATLLGGTVVGSVRDLSATYYNPGGLALSAAPASILGAKAFQFNNIIVVNGAADGVDLSSPAFRPAPDLIAGMISGADSRHRFAYSLLIRQRFDIQLQGRRIDTRDVISNALGVESFAGEILFAQDLTETWGGVTWSTTLGDHIGIGVTQYLAFRTQNSRFHTLAQALTTAQDVAVTISVDDYDFNHLRTLWKTGIAFDLGSLAAGVTITTPSIGLFGSGSATFTRTVAGQDRDGDGILDESFASNFQDGVAANFGSPLSVAFGTAYRVGATTGHFSAEWFDNVSRHQVLATEPFVAQSSGELVSNPLIHELSSVFNYGFGLTHEVSEKFSAFGSVVSDYSGRMIESDANLAISSWDIYHLTGGAAFTVGGTELTVGLGYSFGSAPVQQPIDFTGASEANQLRGVTNPDSRVKFRGFRFIFGFSVARQ